MAGPSLYGVGPSQLLVSRAGLLLTLCLSLPFGRLAITLLRFLGTIRLRPRFRSRRLLRLALAFRATSGLAPRRLRSALFRPLRLLRFRRFARWPRLLAAR